MSSSKCNACDQEATTFCDGCYIPCCSLSCEAWLWDKHKEQCWEIINGQSLEDARRGIQEGKTPAFVRDFRAKLKLLSLSAKKGKLSVAQVQWRVQFILRGFSLLKKSFGEDRQRLVREVGWHVPHDQTYLNFLAYLGWSKVQVVEIASGLGLLAAAARALGVQWEATDAMNGWGSEPDNYRWIDDTKRQTALTTAREWKRPVGAPPKMIVLATAWFPPDSECVEHLEKAVSCWFRRFGRQACLLMIGDQTPRQRNFTRAVRSMVPELQGTRTMTDLIRKARDTTADPLFSLKCATQGWETAVELRGTQPFLPLSSYPRDQQWALQMTGGLVPDTYKLILDKPSTSWLLSFFLSNLWCKPAPFSPSSSSSAHNTVAPVTTPPFVLLAGYLLPRSQISFFPLLTFCSGLKKKLKKTVCD